MDMIADRLWDSRERTFVEKQDGESVMHTIAIAHLGGATLDDRRKLPDQETFHRGWEWSASATRPVYDTAPLCPVWAHHLDAAAPPPRSRIFECGCHPDYGILMAENHPVGFQWVMEARAKGAKSSMLIPVSPALLRWLISGYPCGPGPTLFFSAALINYVIEQRQIFPRLCGSVHECSHHPARRFSGHGRSGRTLLRMGRGKETVRSRTSWLYEGSEQRTNFLESIPATGKSAVGTGKIVEAKPGKLKRIEPDPTLATSALRFPGTQEAFRPLHAGVGGAVLRCSAKISF